MIKCKKCGLRFKDREDLKDSIYYKDLCWNCRFICECFVQTLYSLNSPFSSLKSVKNREIILNLDNLIIRRKDKYREGDIRKDGKVWYNHKWCNKEKIK